jgi:tight adherence protein C
MPEIPIEAILAFGITTLLVIGVSWLFRRTDRTGLARLQDAGGAEQKSLTWLELGQKVLLALPVLGNPWMPRGVKQRHAIENRLRRAGLFHPQAPLVLLGVKAFLGLLGFVVALLCILVQVPPSRALMAGIFASLLGMILPGLWLDRRLAQRQALLRRGLPDALDMMVLCLEGGLSLNGAMQRIRGELASVHPHLTAELSIVEREMIMGISAGEALQKMGERTDLEDLRSLAAVLLQSQRYGASMIKALRTYADSLRMERQQQAEERAQKAAVKILFPTLLCIFPAIFVVILGPAAFQLRDLLANVK